MNKKKRGEIWISQLDKRRPVLIISNDELMVVELDRTIATITSQKPRNNFDIEIKDWKKAGLDKPSIVRCSKLNTIHSGELLYKIGRLEQEDLTNVINKVVRYIQ